MRPSPLSARDVTADREHLATLRFNQRLDLAKARLRAINGDNAGTRLSKGCDRRAADSRPGAGDEGDFIRIGRLTFLIWICQGMRKEVRARGRKP